MSSFFYDLEGTFNLDFCAALITVGSAWTNWKGEG